MLHVYILLGVKLVRKRRQVIADKSTYTVEPGVLISGVVKHTNVVFGATKRVKIL